MKPGLKLLPAPLGVALPAVCAVGLNALLMNRETRQAGEALDTKLQLLRKLGDTRYPLGQAHAGACRIQALFEDLPKLQITAFSKI